MLLDDNALFALIRERNNEVLRRYAIASTSRYHLGLLALLNAPAVVEAAIGNEYFDVLDISFENISNSKIGMLSQAYAEKTTSSSHLVELAMSNHAGTAYQAFCNPHFDEGFLSFCDLESLKEKWLNIAVIDNIACVESCSTQLAEKLEGMLAYQCQSTDSTMALSGPELA